MEEKQDPRGINLAYMDTTVSPKDDFFRYVNGIWIDSTEIPDEYTTWGSFNELRKNTDSEALSLLEKASKNSNLDPSSNQAKAVFLYQSIMDTVSRNERGIEPIKPYLAKIESIQNKEDLQKYLTGMQEYGGAGFFGFTVRADAKDSNKNAAYIYPSGLGLPDRDYYLGDDQSTKDIREKYKAYVSRMLQFLGDSQEEASKKAETILAFETSLAKPQLDKVERRDTRNTYNPMAVSELKKEVPAIDWNQYLEQIGASKVDTVIVSMPKYMQALQTTFSGQNVEDWKTYLRWTLFNDAATTLSTDIERANWEFYDRTLQGAKEMRPLNERALGTVNNTLGEALGKLYVEENFPPEAKQKAQEMIANIIKAFEVRINNLTWMSDSTKVKAIEKLGTTTIKVGYPDEWKDYSELEIYGPNDEEGSYFQNMMNASKWNVNETMAKLGEPRLTKLNGLCLLKR
ncbi:M13 family metallopeptidase [Antarcticibacterium sp. 1MA-6-2]|uniref:M13 family metallopeptidase n=1 Tax=Antarcticibacterium sp. 1MA-6-2 TaxID=2908210 RepID=UPI0038FD051A